MANDRQGPARSRVADASEPPLEASGSHTVAAKALEVFAGSQSEGRGPDS